MRRAVRGAAPAHLGRAGFPHPYCPLSPPPPPLSSFNGGVPQWMRSKAACFRCADPGWEAFSVRVLGLVVAQLRGAGQLWTQGGPVFMLQVENEYSGPDERYLTDMVMAARNLTADVPWVLCHDLELCSKINAAPGAPPGGFALCTINGFWMEQAAPFVDQPSPSWVALQRASNKQQFMGWTEDQGWVRLLARAARAHNCEPAEKAHP